MSTAETKLYENRVNMLAGDMVWTVTAWHQYGSVVTVEVHTTSGLTQTITLSEEDARSVGLALINASNCLGIADAAVR